MRLSRAVLLARRFLPRYLISLLTFAAPGLFAAILSAQPPPSTPALNGEMDLAAYRNELDRLVVAVADLDRHPAGIEPLRQSLPKSWPVRAAGQRFEVSTGWLDSALDTMGMNPVVRASLQKDIEDRLQVLRQQALELEKVASGPRPEEARARLAGILQRREFRSVRGPGWWDQLVARFWSWVGRVLRKLFGGLRVIPRAREIMIWCLIALAFILLALWVKRSLLSGARAGSLELRDTLPPGKSWHDWAKQALGAAARHDYREAVHAAYWAGVFRLAELGAWQLDRARTPREYLRLMAQSAQVATQQGVREARVLGETFSSGPAAHDERRLSPAMQVERAAALAALTRRLESTWYGYDPATAGDFHEAVLQLEALGCRFPSNLATASS